MKQTVAHKKIGTLHGLVLVLGLIVVLVLLNYLVLGFLATYIGNGASSIAFWVLGGAIAWIILRVYIVKYSYELGDEVLRLTRSYGKRERLIADIYLANLLFAGDAAEARKRYPNARLVKATHVKGEYPVTAVAFRASDGNYIALIQANDELKNALRARIKAK